jgi:serine/threonine protein kinase
MSPELLLQGRVSKASDVYALGVLLWELATGRVALQGVPLALLPHQVGEWVWQLGYGGFVQ